MAYLSLVLVACAAVAVDAQCKDENSAEHFTQAVDAALMELQAEKGWFSNLRHTSGFTDAMSISSCTADLTKWSYPPAADAVGVLARVLRTKKIRVAGVQWSKGGAADYKTNPLSPTGFWPDYMQAIADKIASHYGIEITLERVYFPNSRLVGDAVEAAEDVDMSEPYYYLAGFHNSEPRIEALAHSCITAGTASSFYTKKGSGITSVDLLFDALTADTSLMVGFIGQGNYDSVSAILPATTVTAMLTNDSYIEAKVRSGQVIAGYVSEGAPPDAGEFEVFETGIVSPRVALFHKDKLWSECEGGDEDRWSSGELIALIVVAATALVLVLLLGLLIFKERTGSPVFMPLINDQPPTVTMTDASGTSSKPQV